MSKIIELPGVDGVTTGGSSQRGWIYSVGNVHMSTSVSQSKVKLVDSQIKG